MIDEFLPDSLLNVPVPVKEVLSLRVEKKGLEIYLLTEPFVFGYKLSFNVFDVQFMMSQLGTLPHYPAPSLPPNLGKIIFSRTSFIKLKFLYKLGIEAYVSVPLNRVCIE